ncbi:MAG: hypothetical protein WBF48_00710 [Halarcobacter sp.]
MNIEKECEELFDNLRKVLFYVGHGKYNDFMSFEEVTNIKASLEKILALEKEYELATTLEEKEAIYKRLEPFKTFSIRDFLDYKVEKI